MAVYTQTCVESACRCISCFRHFYEVPTAIGTDIIAKAYMVKSDLFHKLARSLGQKLHYFVPKTRVKIMIKKRIRFSFEPRDMLWPLRMGFSFVRIFWCPWCYLQSVWSFQGWPTLYPLCRFCRNFTRASGSCSFSARASFSSTNSILITVLPPTLTFQSIMQGPFQENTTKQSGWDRAFWRNSSRSEPFSGAAFRLDCYADCTKLTLLVYSHLSCMSYPVNFFPTSTEGTFLIRFWAWRLCVFLLAPNPACSSYKFSILIKTPFIMTAADVNCSKVLAVNMCKN